MAKAAKKKSTKSHAPRKKLTSERALRLRPHDPEPPEEAPESKEPKEEGAEEETKRKPRQARLPGAEDPEIEELEAAAEAYADIRDQRQALTTQEVQLKTDLLNIMHANKKTTYNHGGVNVTVLIEKEKVRVRIKKDEE